MLSRSKRRRVLLYGSVVAAVFASLLVPAPAGSSDSPNVAVTSLAHLPYQNYSLAQHPNDPKRLALTYVNGVYANNNLDKLQTCGIGLSDDGGQSWHREVLIGVAPAEGEPRDPDVHGRFQFGDQIIRCRTEGSQEAGTAESPPSVAYGPDGTIYYVLGGLVPGSAGAGARIKIWVLRSRDRGATFQGLGCEDAPVDCLGTPYAPAVTAHELRPHIAVDPVTGRVYLIWNRRIGTSGAVTGGRPGQTENLLVAWSPSTPGQTFEFSPPTVVPEPSPPRRVDGEQFVAVGPPETPGGPGRVYAAWLVPEDYEVRNTLGLGTDLCINSSTDGGQTFSSEPACFAQNVAPDACTGTPYKCEDLYYNYRVPYLELFTIAAGTRPQQVYVAWWERKTAGDKNRIYFRASEDGGRTFAPAKMVGVTQGKSDHEQHRPWMSVAPNGRIDLAYYDITAPTTEGVRLHDVYLTSSCDDGVTFTPPQRVRDADPWNAAFGSPVITGGIGHPDQYGDVAPVGRVAVASTNSIVSAAWTDGRRTLSSNDEAKRKLDVFFGTATPACGATATSSPTTVPTISTTTTTATSSTTSTQTTGRTAPSAPPKGYALAAADGGIFAFNAPFSGSTANLALKSPIVGMVADPDGKGYWLVAADGGVFAFDAPFYGSTGNIALNSPIVGMAADPGGRGYYLVAADGGVFAFGPGARFRGSTGNLRLNKPIVAMAADKDGNGYWLFASDGGVFAFDAAFAGSTGNIRLNQPIVGAAADLDGRGYHLVASDGGVFAFDAVFAGSAGALRLNQPIVGMATDPDRHGYWVVARDGGVFAFGAPFHGSTGAIRLNRPIVAMSSM